MRVRKEGEGEGKETREMGGGGMMRWISDDDRIPGLPAAGDTALQLLGNSETRARSLPLVMYRQLTSRSQNLQSHRRLHVNDA
jgi:hypothetical protein